MDAVGSLVLPALAVAPANPKQGQVYFNTVLGVEQVFNGTSWVTPGLGSLIAHTTAPVTASLGGNTASATYVGPADGTYYTWPNFSLTIPAGIQVDLAGDVVFSPIMNGLAANTDIWWGWHFYDTYAAAVVDGWFRRRKIDVARTSGGVTDYEYERAQAAGIIIPAQAQQRTYQVRIGANANLNPAANGVVSFSGSALNSTMLCRVRAIAC